MTTKHQIDLEVARLLAAHEAAVVRYRKAWGTPDLIPAARDMEQKLENLHELAREHAPLYNTYPP
jgi:hypothetical protein